MSATLTDLSIRKLPAPERGQTAYYDSVLPNFGVRVSHGGTRSFFVLVMIKGRRKRITLGPYPTIKLADARKKARDVLAEVRLGTYDDGLGGTDIRFKDALEDFLVLHCAQRNRPSTAKETERQLRKHFLPKLRNMGLEEIRPQHITSILDRLHDRPSEANHSFGVIRKFFPGLRNAVIYDTHPAMR